MIEVERKFQLSPDNERRLVRGATLIKGVTLRDVYYDAPDHHLTLKDWWLRERNGRWELKIPLTAEASGRRAADQYHELEDDEAIRTALKLSGTGALAEDLRRAGYGVIASITSLRRKFRQGHFIVDLDRMDFGYALCEIELLVEHKKDIGDAIQRILAFASALGLSAAPVRGKVVEFLRQRDPAHYRALVTAGVVADVVYQ